MIISLRALGILEQYLGAGRARVPLSANARFMDLWRAIDVRWGKELPAWLWDAEAKRFQRQVVVMTNGTEVANDDLSLSDQQEVILLVPPLGG